MTCTIQPGQKEGPIAGRLAVDFKGDPLQSSIRSLGCRAVLPSQAAASHRMTAHASIRLCLGAALALLLAAAPALAQTRLVPEPGSRPVRPAESDEAPRIAQNGRPPQSEEHLQRWMQSHSNMSLAEQQRALQNLPGFRELPPQVQQNRLNTLARLYYMNPQQRSRILNRTEALERLAPAQREQWREAVQRLNMLPPPRKHMLAGAIIELRELPPEQRQMALNSPSYLAQYTPEERQTLRTLLMAEPYPAVRTPRRAYPPPPMP